MDWNKKSWKKSCTRWHNGVKEVEWWMIDRHILHIKINMYTYYTIYLNW